MNRTIIAVFPDEKTARKSAQTLKDRLAGGPVTLVGMSVISKDPHGRLTVAEEYHESTYGGVVAAVFGALVGWVTGGPVAALIFAGGGALFGLSADMIHRSGHSEAVKRASIELPRAKSAVTVHISEATDSSISTMMKCLGGRVLAPGT